MKIIQMEKVAEIPNPHFISARVLLAADGVQFEHLRLEPGEEQKLHMAYTNVYLYVLEGDGLLVAGDEQVSLQPNLLVAMPPEVPHRLVNSGTGALRILNVKSPRPDKPTHLVSERSHG